MSEERDDSDVQADALAQRMIDALEILAEWSDSAVIVCTMRESGFTHTIIKEKGNHQAIDGSLDYCLRMKRIEDEERQRRKWREDEE